MNIRFMKKCKKMESISTNYKKFSDIQEELRNVNIENYLKFNFQGNYEFRRCEYCDGSMLGHMVQKCQKLDYDERVIKKFERHLENIGGFQEAIERREMSHREKIAKWVESKTVPNPVQAVGTGGTTQLSKPRLPPLWTGQKFDRWKIEVEK